jgi:hypothetical protein
MEDLTSRDMLILVDLRVLGLSHGDATKISLSFVSFPRAEWPDRPLCIGLAAGRPDARASPEQRRPRPSLNAPEQVATSVPDSLERCSRNWGPDAIMASMSIEPDTLVTDFAAAADKSALTASQQLDGVLPADRACHLDAGYDSTVTRSSSMSWGSTARSPASACPPPSRPALAG